MSIDWKHDIDNDWSLMLDRDGVINRRILGGYVTSWSEFEFLPGVVEAMALFARLFKYIFIITNQQGVGKGLMSMEQVDEIHNKMCDAIERHGGRVDGILVCPQRADEPDNYRKPNPRMALMAQGIAPDLDLRKCIMVGDSSSDIDFGHNAGTRTVFIGVDKNQADDSFESLYQFSQAFIS